MTYPLYILPRDFGVYICTDRDELMNFAAAFGWLDLVDEFMYQHTQEIKSVKFLMDRI